MHGAVEIDGHAFCLGIDVLRPTLGDSLCLVTSLIRGANFRSRHISSMQAGLSLDMCPLGEFVDKYRTYKAIKSHDKIYALLGMSSDGLSVASLQPDYNPPWKEVMLSLVRFLIGKRPYISTLV
jgi:hypothetical protein